MTIVCLIMSGANYAQTPLNDKKAKMVILQAPSVSNAVVSMDQAAKVVLGRMGGHVLRATRKQAQTGTVYHIRLLFPSGKVKTFRVDGNSGEIIH